MTKKALYIIGGVLFLSILAATITYIRLVNVTLTINDITSATVIYNGLTVAGSNSPGTFTFKAPPDAKLLVTYTGDATHESSSRTIKTTTKDLTTTVSPFYNKQELQKQARSQSESIIRGLSDYNSTIPLSYALDNLVLHRYGDWASAQLVWFGDETENSDTLRVVLKKTNNEWTVANQPDILLYKEYYSDVPTEVLRTANNY